MEPDVIFKKYIAKKRAPGGAGSSTGTNKHTACAIYSFLDTVLFEMHISVSNFLKKFIYYYIKYGMLNMRGNL